MHFKVNRSRELVVVVKCDGGGQLHQKAGNIVAANVVPKIRRLQAVTGRRITLSVLAGVVSICLEGSSKSQSASYRPSSIMARTIAGEQPCARASLALVFVISEQPQNLPDTTGKSQQVLF
jgi:hypothetical protein